MKEKEKKMKKKKKPFYFCFDDWNRERRTAELTDDDLFPISVETIGENQSEKKEIISDSIVSLAVDWRKMNEVERIQRESTLFPLRNGNETLSK